MKERTSKRKFLEAVSSSGSSICISGEWKPGTKAFSLSIVETHIHLLQSSSYLFLIELLNALFTSSSSVLQLTRISYRRWTVSSFIQLQGELCSLSVCFEECWCFRKGTPIPSVPSPPLVFLFLWSVASVGLRLFVGIYRIVRQLCGQMGLSQS